MTKENYRNNAMFWTVLFSIPNSWLGYDNAFPSRLRTRDTASTATWPSTSSRTPDCRRCSESWARSLSRPWPLPSASTSTTASCCPRTRDMCHDRGILYRSGWNMRCQMLFNSHSTSYLPRLYLYFSLFLLSLWVCLLTLIM